MIGTAAQGDGIRRLREAFPGLKRWTYMDVAARGLLSSEVRAAIDAHLDQRMLEGADKAALFAMIEETRGRFAQLINAAPDEIAFTRNVSDGINAFAASLPWRPGDNVVLCEGLEHPANLYPWYGARDRHGIEVRLVAAEAGRVAPERVLDAIDGRTRALSVSSVSFSPGFALPIEKLGRACRERGVLFVVDAAQSAGVLHVDVQAMGADALAVSTQKGLLGLYGMGFLYVRREVANGLRPVYLSRFAVDQGDAHEAAAAGADYRLMAGARRFDVGNYNYVGAIAVNRSMAMLQAVGTPAIEAHVRGLARRLAWALHHAGLPMFGGAPGDDLAHIVPIGRLQGDQHDATEDEEMRDLHGFLVANRVRLSIRRGLLRLSLHLYNDENDVDRVVELAKRWRG
jgi:cysteine desulfurase / selenocysteine lyase